MNDLVFDTANKEDIPELVRLRMAYISDDFGFISEYERSSIEKQLQDFFDRKLGKELIGFVARTDTRLVAAAHLLIIEKPANPSMPNGSVSEILSVFTEQEYRRQGISTQLLKNVIAYAREKDLCFIDLKATEDGYSLYRKLGFENDNTKYKNMRLKL